MRVLDLGCGAGRGLARWKVSEGDEVTGLDIDRSALAIAQTRYPERKYVHGSGESLPFPSGGFDRVICAIALPYMDIPRALREIHRILISGGQLTLSLHPFTFTLRELRLGLPRLIPTVFRCYVLANGFFFHCTGRTFSLAGKTESFQTESGMQIALNRAGFADCEFLRGMGPVGPTLWVEAKKTA